MPKLLTQEWLDLQRSATEDLPERPGASAVITYEVVDGPDGTVTFHTKLADGRIVTNVLGPADDPDFTMRVPHDEFLAVVRGELDPQVGFMQGRIKVTGNIGRMLSVLPLTCSDDWRDVTSTMLEQTDF